MARIRSIKPEFWSDEKLSECSLSARLTFIGLWTFADDEGRMEFQPIRLRMQIYPCGSVTLVKLREYLGELSERSLIRLYVVDGKEYLDIPGFAKHQRINRPTESRLPDYSMSTHGALNAPSPLERKGKEGRGSAQGCASPHDSLAEPPEGLDLEAWGRWVFYRQRIKKPLRDVSIPAAQREMAALGADQAAAVEHTIAKGWTGLRAPEKPKIKTGEPNGIQVFRAGGA